MLQYKTKKRHLFTVWSCLLYLIIAAVMLLGVTLSRYVASSFGSDKAKVAMIKDLTITESGDYYENGKWVVAPGADIHKNAVVSFEGSETACYVFLEIDADNWQISSTDGYTFSYSIDNIKDSMVWSVNDEWSYLCETDNGAVFYKVLSPNISMNTDIIKSGGQIKVSPDIKRSQLMKMPSDLTLKFKAFAVQYSGFSEGLPEGYTSEDRALNAWSAVEKNG